jgi:Na+/melibiose symporter-like transporter
VQAGQILAAAVFLPLSYALSKEAFLSWGWRIPFLLSVLVLIVGVVIRREVEETPAFREEQAKHTTPTAPVREVLTNHSADLLRVMGMALMNVIPVVATIFGAAYAVQPGYGVQMDRSVYLWIPVVGNIVAVIVIPFVGALSDRIGRRPPIIVGAETTERLAERLRLNRFERPIGFRHCGQCNAAWDFYQGYNAVFPSFYPELFPTRARVSGMAIAQNIGTMLTAFLPALFATVAPPGSTNVPLTVGAIAFGVTIISALAAWSARETYRMHLNDLGDSEAPAVDKAEYDRLRQQSVAAAT